MSFISCSPSAVRLLFPVHPSALEDFVRGGAKVDARDATADSSWLWALVPSSTRTLRAWPDGVGERAEFVKTSLHSPIDVGRRITRIGVGCAVGLNTLVAHAREQLPSKLHDPRYSDPHRAINWICGALVRLAPPEVSDGHTRLAPLFSLVGGHDGRVPLLPTMLERTDVTPVEFVDRLWCVWFAPLWLACAGTAEWLGLAGDLRHLGPRCSDFFWNKGEPVCTPLFVWCWSRSRRRRGSGTIAVWCVAPSAPRASSRRSFTSFIHCPRAAVRCVARAAL